MGTFTGTAGDDVLTGTADNDVFDLTQGGNDTVQGLAGDDVVKMGGTLTAADRIDGGDGNDTVELSGDYSKGLVFAASTMMNVEVLSLGWGHSYKLSFNDANVAAGEVLTIDGSNLGAGNVLTIDGSAETDGGFSITGGAGKDVLTGGGGQDVIYGGPGDDVIHGGAGNDTLGDWNEPGNNTVYGDAGNDWIVANNSDVAFGGEGDDTISGNSHAGSHLTLSGDAGNDDLGVDTLADADQMAVLSGGDGQDYFTFTGDGQATADGGADTDVFYLQQTGNGVTITLGEGMDVVLPDPRYVGQQVTEITDFSTGDGGDVVYLRDYLLALFPSWAPTQDPFALGYVQVIQSGPDAILQVKSGDSWQPVLVFDNTLASSLVPGDSIRWGYSLSTPILVTTSLTIASDQVITAFACPGSPPGDWYYGSAVATGFASGINVINNGQILLNGLGLNLDWTGGAGGKVDGIYVSEWGATIENHGVIATVARAPLYAAEGIRTYGSVPIWNTGEIVISAANAAGIDGWDSPYVINDGRIEVHAPGEAYGLIFWEGPDVLTNTGTILVTGFDPVAVEADDAGFNTVTNSGTIEADGGDSVGIIWMPGSPCEIDNSGSIIAVTAIYEQRFQDYGGATVRNSGLIQGLISLNDGNNSVYNSGRIVGDVLLGPHSDLFDGRGGSVTGIIDGEGGNDIYIIGNAGDVVREEANAGIDTVKTTLSSYALGANLENLTYIGSGNFTGSGNALANTVIGGAGNDVFFLSQGGDDVATGGAGNDRFDFGGAFSAADSVDGGTGTDVLVLNGDYSAGVTFAASTVINVEAITLAAGHSYKLVTNDATVVAGQTLQVDGSALAAGNALIFDGSSETNGNFVLLGGAGNDMLTGGAGSDTVSYSAATGGVTVDLSITTAQYVGGGEGTDTLVSIENLEGSKYNDILKGNSGANTIILSDGGNDTALAGDGNDAIVMGAVLTAADKIDGGAGTDKVTLDGDYSAGVTFSATTMVNVETLAVAAGHNYNLTLDNANVAAGQTLAVDASALGAGDTLTFNGSAETDGFFAIKGGAGNDTVVMGAVLKASDRIDGGGGSDKVLLNGDYSAGFTFSSTTMINVETLGLAAGHSYSLTTNNATVAAGQTFTVDGSLLGASDVLVFSGSAETDGMFVVAGGAGNDTMTGGAGDDLLNISKGGNDTVRGGNGNDTIFAGAMLTGNDAIDGGSGSDKVTLIGDYSAGVVFSATTMVNVETITLGTNFSYKLTLNDASVAAGQTLTVVASGLHSDNTLIFDGSAETDGFFAIKGGTGNDTVIMGAVLKAADKIDGGAGTDKVLLNGDYSAGFTFSSTTMINVETLGLAAGHSYSLTTSNATVGAGQTLTVDGSLLGASDVLTFDGSAETDGKLVILGGAGNDSLTSGAGDDTLSGGAGDDTLVANTGGNDTVSGGDGNDTIRMGAMLTSQDSINGGLGSDAVWLYGDYSGLVFSATTMVNVETLMLGSTHSYGLTSNDATVAAGQTLTVNASALKATDSVMFNGSAETDGKFAFFGGAGNDVLTGGAGADQFDLSKGGNDTALGGSGNDTFILGATLTAADHVDGGAGTDTLSLNGDYSAGLVFSSTTMTNVETLQLTAGHSYTLTTSDATVAAGQTLTVNAKPLGHSDALIFDGSAEHDGSFVVTGGSGNDSLTGGTGRDTLTGGNGDDRLTGGGGGDHLTGGQGHNSFIYGSVGESTGPGFDTISHFNVKSDQIDLWFKVTGIDQAVSGGTLTSGNFDADLAAALGSAQLGSDHAVLFAPSSGDYIGETFLVVDANGIAGYQAGQDLVIEFDSTAHLDHFKLSDFAVTGVI